MAVCIQTGLIVWVNGPYPCGRWPDLAIFRHRLVEMLDMGEWIVTDEGYSDGREFCLNKKWRGFPRWWKRMAARALSKHERINSELKRFQILSTAFRGKDLDEHGEAFMAIANVVQIQMMLSESYMSYYVYYDDTELFTADGDLREFPAESSDDEN